MGSDAEETRGEAEQGMSDLERLDPDKARELAQVAASAKRGGAAKQMRACLDHTGATEISEAEVEADVMRAVQEVRHGKLNEKGI